MVSKQIAFLTKTAVSERPGWSLTLVAKLLGEPDQRKKVYGRSIPLALYAVRRVEQAEGSMEFSAAQFSLAKRKIAADLAVATKKARLLEAIRAMPITVERWGLARVRSKAIDSYNSRNDRYSLVTPHDAPAFLDRITVNFIRHELTQYDLALWEVTGKTGICEAVMEIRKRVYGAIKEIYPDLSWECERQLAERL